MAFDYADESDEVGYPFGSDTKIEGGRSADGDRHAIVVDRSTCRLYETWSTYQRADGRWTAGSGATWRLTEQPLAPAGLDVGRRSRAADPARAAALSDEVRAGRVDHAIRFTTDVTDRKHMWPARHDAGSVSDPAYPPMGARFRLKASFPIKPATAPTPAPCCAA